MLHFNRIQKHYVHDAGEEDLQRLSVTPRFLWQGSRLLWTFVLIFLYFWINVFLKGYGLREIMNRIKWEFLMLGSFFTKKNVGVCGLVAVKTMNCVMIVFWWYCCGCPVSYVLILLCIFIVVIRLHFWGGNVWQVWTLGACCCYVFIAADFVFLLKWCNLLAALVQFLCCLFYAIVGLFC